MMVANPMNYESTGFITCTTDSTNRTAGRVIMVQTIVLPRQVMLSSDEKMMSDANAVGLISLNKKWYETDSYKDVREIDILEDKKGEDPTRRIQKNDLKHLYNLEADISETTNLYKENRAQFEQQKAEMKEWESELKDPAFTGLLGAKKAHQKKLKAKRKTK